MANKSKYAYNRSYYENLARRNAYNGNAARKLAVVEDEYEADEDIDELWDEEEYEYEEPAYEPERRTSERKQREVRPERRPEANTVARPKVRYKININYLSVTVFLATVMLLVFCAFRFLEVQSNISQTDKLLKTAQTKLDDVESLNASLVSALDTEIDRNYIYSVAVGKLGMVYPDKNQVVYYEAVQEGYVRQLAEIPQN